MGFAAHLRYHWMEPVVYKSLLYIPLAIIGGFDAQDVAIVYFFAIAVGHLNHANLGWDYGYLKYIFNQLFCIYFRVFPSLHRKIAKLRIFRGQKEPNIANF